MLLKGYAFSLLYAFLCLALGLIFYKLKTPKKITRKIVHVLVGFEWFILYHYFGAGLNFLAVCLIFLVILIVAYKRRLLPMISSDEDNSPGTVYYALAMSIMALLCVFVPKMLMPFGVGVLCTSLGDGFAGLSGQLVSSSWNVKIYGNKTIFGSFVNLTICCIAIGFFNSYFSIGMEWWHIIAIAFFATELELLSGRGLDNISITIGSSLRAFAFINMESIDSYLVPILLTPIMVAFAYKKKSLTVDGIAAALVIDIVISITLGNFGFIILLAFFIGGILNDKIKKTHQKTKQNLKSGHEQRNAFQVLANSMVAVVCSIFYFVTKERMFLMAFVAAFAESIADTAASGVGVLSDKAFDPFRMKPCRAGLSGGMSLLGTLVSFAQAFLLSLVAFALNAITFPEALFTCLIGFLGGVFDSFLGSALQIKFKCKICNNIVESEEHCETKAERYSGLIFVDNNTVNFLSTLFAALLCIIILL